VRFEWDPRKAEAATVFDDAFALTREDPDAAEEISQHRFLSREARPRHQA